MADVQSNIHVNIDTSGALASLKQLQRQISAFHTQMAKSGAAASAVSANQAQNLMNAINATGKFQASMRNVTSSTESFTNALEKNKLSSREYFRYSVASTKTFGRLFKSEFDTVSKVARERVKDLQTQYIKMGRGANGAIQSIAVRPLTLDMTNLGTQTAMAAQKQQVLNQLLRQGATNVLNFGKNVQWSGRQLMVGFTVPLVYLGTAAAKTFMKLEEQAIRFKRVYGEMFTTAEETDAMVKDIQLLASEYTKYGVAVEATMKMAADAAAQGKMGADLMAQVAQATRLAVLGGVEQEQALATTISVTNAFGVATEDLASKIDFLNAVENQTVVSIEDLTIAMPKAGPVVKQLGGDVEDLAFFLTAMKEGGINASEGANALKSGLASLINPSDKASKMLQGLGINIKGIVESNKGDVKSTVIDFAKALDTLDPLNRARAIEQLFGKFQFSRLSTLFQNVVAQGTQAERVLKLTQSTTEELAILSERELGRIENTTTYKFKKSIEDLKVTLAPVGEAFLKALTPIVEFASKILDKFNGLGEGSKKFLTILTIALGAIGPLALMSFGLLANGVANIMKLFISLKGIFNKTGASTQILGAQTSYMTQEQLDAAAVAASLNQVHTTLKQTFTSEATAVNALAQAYRNAVAAQVGFTGPVRGAAPKLKKFKTGTTAVPGQGNQDTVHALLTPGEAVIPQKVAQDPEMRPIIKAMVDKDLQGALAAAEGSKEAKKVKENQSHVGGKSAPKNIEDIIKQNPYMTNDQRHKLIAMGQLFKSQGISETTNTKHGLMFDFPEGMNKVMPYGGVPTQDFVEEWEKRGAEKWKASKLTATQAKAMDDGFLKLIKDSGRPYITDNFFDELYREKLPKIPGVVESEGYKKSRVLYETNSMFNMGRGLGTTPEKSLEILKEAKAKGFILDYTLKTGLGSGKGRESTVVTKSATVTLPAGTYYGQEIPETTVGLNRMGTGTNPTISQSSRAKAEAKAAGIAKAPILVDLETVMAHADKLKPITDDAEKSKSGKKKPTDFGRQISPTKGYSFPVQGVGGIFEKPNGKKVFVKPVLDEKAAIAEQRATKIARDVHGLNSPKQTIRTMVDPTDLDGKRKIIVLESPFDPKFDPEKMTNKFAKDEYFKQLVAANLRADKDLGRGNLSANVLADVGTSGVFDKASGKRDYVLNLPSMEDQGRMILSDTEKVPGRKKFFSQATADIARSMTPDDYHKAMIAEIDRTLPKLKETIAKFNLDPSEKPVYDAMIKRLEEGRKVDWRGLHKIHSAVVVKPNELLQDDKTGELTKPKTERKPAKVSSSSGSPKDTRTTQVPKGKTVVQKPRLLGKIIRPGFANAPEANSTAVNGIIQGARDAASQARLAGKEIGTAISQSAAAASRTALYGTGPMDANAKSVRRRLQKENTARFKREQRLAESQAKAAQSRTTLYGSGPIDAEAKSVRRKLEKDTAAAAKESRRLSNLAANPVIPASIIPAAEKQTVRGRINTFRQERADKKAAAKSAGTAKPGMGLAGGAMAAGGVAMMASMIPGSVGEMASKLMMPLMGLGMILPMLGSVTGALAVAALAAVGAIVKLRMEFDKSQDDALKLETAMGSGRDAMRGYAKFAGNVTAGEIMQRRSQEKFGLVGAKPGKTTFGESFVASKDGKEMIKSIAVRTKNKDIKGATDDISNQLMSSVMSGAMNAQQAKSIALNLGQKTGNYGLGFAVTARINELLGPNGENLEKNPLEIRTKLISEKATKSKDLFDQMQSKAGRGGFANLGAVNPKVNVGGQTALGAGIGAGIGTMIMPGVGTLIGTGLGAIAGAAGGYFSGRSENKKAGAMSGAVVASQRGQLEQQQEMVDSLDLYYQGKLKELQVEGDITKEKIMQKRYDDERLALVAKSAEISKNIMSSYASTKGNVRSAMDTGVDKMLTQKYKGTDEIQYLDAAKVLIKDSGLTQEQQYLIKVKMSTGELTPSQQVFLFSNFGDNKEVKQQYMKIIADFSARTGEEATRVMGMFTNADGTANTKLQTDFIAKVSTKKNDKEASDYINFFAEVANTNGVFDMSAVIQYYISNPKVAETTKSLIDNIEKNKGKLNLDVMTNFLPENVMGSIDKDYFEKLSQGERLTYLKEIATLVNIPDPVLSKSDDYLKWEKEGALYNGVSYSSKSAGEKLAAYRQFAPYKVTQESIAQAKTVTTGGTTKNTDKKIESSPLDELLKKLRDVRKNQILVTEGFDASSKALNKLFGGSKDIKIFSGIENDIRRLGGSEGLIEMIIGMDPKEYEAQKNKLFEFDKKTGEITKIKDTAKSISDAIASIALGDFMSAQQRVSVEVQNQYLALDKLTAAGLDASVALEAVGDAGFAAAVANKKLSPDQVIKMVKEYKKATKAATEFKNVQALIALGTRFDQEAKALKELSKVFGQYTQVEMDAIMSNPDLQQALVDGLSNPTLLKQFKENLEKALQDVNVQMNLKKMTTQGMQDVFSTGLSNAMEAFDVQENSLRLKFDIDNKGLINSVEDSQNQISKLQFDVGVKEAGLKEIEQQEERINETYDARIEALDEVGKANSRISQQQKGQLTLAEALTSGDISAAARAVQDIRAQQASDAVDKQKEAMERSRTIALANVKNSNGKTRKELEKEIKVLEDQIFNLEQKLNKDQEDLRLKELILQADIEKITVLGKTRKEFELIANAIDLARVSSQHFLDTISHALDVVERLKVAYSAQTSGFTPFVSPTPAVQNATVTKTPAQLKEEASKAAADAYAAAKAKGDINAAAVAAAGVNPSALAAGESGAIGAASIASQLKAAVDRLAATAQAAKNIDTLARFRAKEAADELAYNAKGRVGRAKGGIIPRYFNLGGFAKGTDTVPAMLTPGEFIMSKYAVDAYGVNTMKAINNGQAATGSVYNNTYALTVNAKTDANPDQIAQAVMSSIKRVDDRRIRGVSLNGR